MATVVTAPVDVATLNSLTIVTIAALSMTTAAMTTVAMTSAVTSRLCLVMTMGEMVGTPSSKISMLGRNRNNLTRNSQHSKSTVDVAEVVIESVTW